jgi:hypothetical protein
MSQSESDPQARIQALEQEVDHWIGRYNELENWRIQQSVQLASYQQKNLALSQQLTACQQERDELRKALYADRQ